jgi:hypothetical protein
MTYLDRNFGRVLLVKFNDNHDEKTGQFVSGGVLDHSVVEVPREGFRVAISSTKNEDGKDIVTSKGTTDTLHPNRKAAQAEADKLNAKPLGNTYSRSQYTHTSGAHARVDYSKMSAVQAKEAHAAMLKSGWKNIIDDGD